MKLNDIRIRTRLLLGYIISGLVCALILIFLLFSQSRLAANYENIINNRIEIEKEILNSRIYISSAARYLRDIEIDEQKQNYESNIQKVNDSLTSLEQSISHISQNYPKVIGDGQETAFLEKVEAWKQVVPSILDLLEKGNFKAAGEQLLNECTPALAELSNQGKQLTASMESQNQELIAKQQSTTARNMVIIAVVFILVMILEILFALRVVNSLVKPISEVENALVEMSQGRLDAPVSYEGNDEIGAMADALRTSQDVLKSAISEINSAAGQMADGNFNISLHGRYPGALQTIPVNFSKMVQKLSYSINGIKQMVEQVSQSAQQVAAGSQSQAQGATEQASSVEELSATLNDVSMAARQNAESAKSAKENTDKAGRQNSTSKEKMEEMMKAMDKIIATSQEIRKINKTIEDIAFQTNILSLNAAVEAARAGSAGKGFAVVADEVRNLAHKSSEASKDTTALIEDSIQAVKNGSEIAQSVAQSIESSDALSARTVQEISQIAAAIERESEAIAQITEGIDQISTVVQTSSATSQESAAVSQELSNQALQIRKLVDGFTTVQQEGSSVPGYSAAVVTAGNQAAVSAMPHPVQVSGAKRYELTPDLLTGNELVDSEHYQLFDALNELMDACSQGIGREKIGDTADFLADYVDKHFGDEEELQKKNGYPDYEPHHRFHVGYQADMRKAANSIRVQGPTMENLAEINRLAGVLVSHIRRADKRMADFVRSKQNA